MAFASAVGGVDRPMPPGMARHTMLSAFVAARRQRPAAARPGGAVCCMVRGSPVSQTSGPSEPRLRLGARDATWYRVAQRRRSCSKGTGDGGWITD